MASPTEYVFLTWEPSQEGRSSFLDFQIPEVFYSGEDRGLQLGLWAQPFGLGIFDPFSEAVLRR